MPELLHNSLGPPPSSFMGDVIELSLLLPAEQATELEAIAYQRGATTGEMVRRLVRDYLTAQKTEGSGGVPWMFRNHLAAGNKQ